MKLKTTTLILLLTLFVASNAFALSSPSVNNLPDGPIDADFFELDISVEEGAKVTVIGGSSPISPMVDGAGKDDLDGRIKIDVGLVQDEVNSFSINVEKDGEFSDTINVLIEEQEDISTPQKGDIDPPEVPIIDEINNPVIASKYEITGSVEASANIYVKDTTGETVATTQANANGIFAVTVDLESGKTNRFNVSAEDAAYNMSDTVQVVIQALPTADDNSDTVDEKIEEVLDQSIPFQDIENHWGRDFIIDIYLKGIVSGKSDTAFEPDTEITRAELTKIALLAFDYEVPAEVDGAVFSDVPGSAWFAPYVDVAQEEGIVSGFEDGFHPNKTITRAAALKILLEASGLYYEGAEQAGFSDVSPNDWFFQYVAYASESLIVGGYSDGTFRPGNSVTRAQVAKMVVKIMELANQ